MVYMAYKDLYQMSNTEVRPPSPPWLCRCEGQQGGWQPCWAQGGRVAGSPLHLAGPRGSSALPSLPLEGCPWAAGMVCQPRAGRAPTLQAEAEVWRGDH